MVLYGVKCIDLVLGAMVDVGPLTHIRPTVLDLKHVPYVAYGVKYKT